MEMGIIQFVRAADPMEMTAWTDSAVPRPESTVERASWWLPQPGWLGGIASIGGVFGLIPFDSRRFHPAADIAMLRRDGSVLMVEYKRSATRAKREAVAEENAGQERLFDPDKG